MQQQRADYDLLAVFPDETKAEAATAKLQKEGFGTEEVFQLPATIVKNGQFRDHGPSRNRDEMFLQTRQTGPNPLLIVLLAIGLGIVFGGIGFALPAILLAVHLASFHVADPTSGIEGTVVGVVLGVVIGLLRRGPVRGNIGQEQLRSREVPAPKPATSSGARTVVALRFPADDNISRRTRARAILLNNGGRIDRSVSQRE